MNNNSFIQYSYINLTNLLQYQILFYYLSYNISFNLYLFTYNLMPPNLQIATTCHYHIYGRARSG
jgi:hypothetical protein